MPRSLFKLISSDLSVEQSRLQRWQSLVTADQKAIFQTIRGLENFKVPLHNFLGTVDLISKAEFPTWGQLLCTLLNHSQHPLQQPQHQPTLDLKKIQSSLPFVHALFPFALSASRIVRDRIVLQHVSISPQAWLDLQQQLLINLCDAVAPCLLDHFSRYRMVNNPLLVLRPDFCQAYIGTACYENYVAQLKSSNFIHFFEEYPVAARAIGVLIEHWIEAVEEFFKRLDQDFPELLSVFKLTETTITALQMDVSNSHNRGRSVVIITLFMQIC